MSMTDSKFGRRCREVMATNPIHAFAQELFYHVTENELVDLLASQPRLPDPFKSALHSAYRDVRNAIAAEAMGR